MRQSPSKINRFLLPNLSHPKYSFHFKSKPPNPPMSKNPSSTTKPAANFINSRTIIITTTSIIKSVHHLIATPLKHFLIITIFELYSNLPEPTTLKLSLYSEYSKIHLSVIKNPLLTPLPNDFISENLLINCCYLCKLNFFYLSFHSKAA